MNIGIVMKNMDYGLTPTLKTVVVLIMLVSTIWVGAWQMDTRYAKASEMKQQIGGLTVLYLESELRALRRQLFELLVASEQRRLTPLELQRMDEIKREIQRLEIKVARIEDGKL